MISGWERSPFDLRRRREDASSGDIRQVVVPSDMAATLRTLLLLDTTAERIVFRARASAEGIVLDADEDDLDELTEHLAAESNRSGCARTGASRPRPPQHLADHGLQLADMPEAERPQ